jgi:hypothetical protein
MPKNLPAKLEAARALDEEISEVILRLAKEAGPRSSQHPFL